MDAFSTGNDYFLSESHLTFSEHVSVQQTYFPFNNYGWFEWVFGLLAGLFIPLNMHYNMDCYAASALTLDWFVSSNRAWTLPFGLRGIRGATMFDAWLEPIFTLITGSFSVYWCLQ